MHHTHRHIQLKFQVILNDHLVSVYYLGREQGNLSMKAGMMPETQGVVCLVGVLGQ